MFEWLKNKLFGVNRVVFYDEPTVEITALSKKPKKIVPKIQAVKKPVTKKTTVVAKKPTVKKKIVVTKPKK